MAQEEIGGETTRLESKNILIHGKPPSNIPLKRLKHEKERSTTCILVDKLKNCIAAKKYRHKKQQFPQIANLNVVCVSLHGAFAISICYSNLTILTDLSE